MIKWMTQQRRLNAAFVRNDKIKAAGKGLKSMASKKNRGPEPINNRGDYLKILDDIINRLATQ